MPTTSNFGWTTPADTDLVKDGAAAIRTLGNGIDTSLVDLKGGTTNQVLAKNSNTDLDFKWVADATGIPATIFDAKGDIIAATAADTAARLAVGANGTVLMADSGESTGLKWGTVSAGSWTQSATGTLSGNQVNVTGLSAKRFFVVIDGMSHGNVSSDFYIGVNNFASILSSGGTSKTLSQGTLAANTGAADAYYSWVYIDLADTSIQAKPIWHSASFDTAGQMRAAFTTSAITQINFKCEGANTFDAGTYYVWSFN